MPAEVTVAVPLSWCVMVIGGQLVIGCLSLSWWCVRIVYVLRRRERT